MYDTNSRADLAKQFTERVADYTKLTPYSDLTLGDLIMRVDDPNSTLSMPLVEIDERPSDVPRAWRFKVPVKSSGNLAVTQVDFGISNEFFTGEDTVESRLSHEFQIDRDLKGNKKINPAVDQLFKLMGGDLVGRVVAAQGPFFSAIERRFRIVEEGDRREYLSWSHLTYHRELLRTQQHLQKFVEMQRKAGLEVADWMYEGALPQNRYKYAEYMALSALATTVQVDTE